MKTHILTLAVLSGLVSGGVAEDATAKPLVSLTVKRQLLSADKDDRGPRSESRDKEMTLRVAIKNLSNSTLEGAELTGEILVNRANNDKERMVKELLKSLKLPPMKPNENLTVDLGKFTLTEVKWHGRTFEETLGEWKVVCKKGEANIGQSVSDEKYEEIVKEMEKERKNDKEQLEQEVIRIRDKEKPRDIRRNLRK